MAQKNSNITWDCAVSFAENYSQYFPQNNFSTPRLIPRVQWLLLTVDRGSVMGQFIERHLQCFNWASARNTNHQPLTITN